MNLYNLFHSNIKRLPGSLELLLSGFLNHEHTEQFLCNVHREECDRDPVVYCKAIRATLLALGYDMDWVDGEFCEMLEMRFIYKD